MDKILGQALKKEREMRGISLADIAAETRIGTRYLLALENEDFSMFSGIFYIRYYIKNYLQACGADETAFFNTHYSYLQSILEKKGAPPPDQYLSKVGYLKFKRRKTILIILLLLLTAVFFYWFFNRSAHVENGTAQFEFPSFSGVLLPDVVDSCRDWSPVNLSMTFVDSCWLQFWRGNQKLAEKVFKPGDALDGHGYQFTLVLSKPGAVRLIVNGREWPRLPESANGLKLTLSPDKV